MVRRKPIYLDHAAGTYLLPAVKQCIQDWTLGDALNPSSIHQAGRVSASALDNSRMGVAKALGVKPSEILFTSGGTEANNLAILGAAEALQDRGRHIITSATEHPSVLDSCKALEKRGFHVTYLSCDENGDVDLNEFRNKITDETILATFMWVNNETGLIHPIEALSRICHEQGVRFHCDAVQAVGHIPIDLQDLPIDSLTLSGHKLGAPAGVGALYVRKGHALSAQSFGGSQEQSTRAGTQNHLGAAALMTASQYHTAALDRLARMHSELKDLLIEGISPLPGVSINRNGGDYSPHILSCSFEDLDGEALFIRLDMAGIAVSNGAACSSGSQAPSHVLKAQGFDSDMAQATIRISLGTTTTKQEIEIFCHELWQIVQSLHKVKK